MAKGGNSVHGGNNPGVSNGCKNAGPSAVGHNPHCSPNTDSNVGGGGGTVVSPNPVTNVGGGALTDLNWHVPLLEVNGAGSCSDSSRDPYFLYNVVFQEATKIEEVLDYVFTPNWSLSDGRVAFDQITASDASIQVDSSTGRITVPPGVERFSIQIPIKRAQFDGSEKLRLDLTDYRNGTPVSGDEFFTTSCSASHAALLSSSGSCARSADRSEAELLWKGTFQPGLLRAQTSFDLELDPQGPDALFFSTVEIQGQSAAGPFTRSVVLDANGKGQVVFPRGTSSYSIAVTASAPANDRIRNRDVVFVRLIDRDGLEILTPWAPAQLSEDCIGTSVSGELLARGACVVDKETADLSWTGQFSVGLAKETEFELNLSKLSGGDQLSFGDVRVIPKVKGVAGSAIDVVLTGDQGSVMLPLDTTSYEVSVTARVPVGERIREQDVVSLGVTNQGLGIAAEKALQLSEDCLQTGLQVRSTKAEGSCADQNGDFVFLYHVKLKNPAATDDYLPFQLQRSWGVGAAHFKQLEVTSGSQILPLLGDQISVPAGVDAFTIKVVVDQSQTVDQGTLSLELTDANGEISSAVQALASDCEPLAHVDLKAITGQGSCVDSNGDPYVMYSVSFNKATQVNERIQLDLQRSWGRGDGRLGALEVTSGSQLLTVVNDQIVVPVGVRDFTVKVPVKRAQFTGGEHVTLTLKDEKGGELSDQEGFAEDCAPQVAVTLDRLEPQGGCVDDQGQAYFLFDVAFDHPSTLNERLDVALNPKFDAALGQVDLAAVNAYSAAGSLTVDVDRQQIVIPARTQQFSLRVPVRDAVFEGGEQLELQLSNDRSDVAVVDTFTPDCAQGRSLPDVHLFLLMDQSTSMNNPDPLVELASTNTRIEAQDRLAFLAYESALQQAGYGFRKVGSKTFKRIGDVPLIDTRSNSSRSVAEVLKRYELADDPGDARTPGDVHVHLIKYGYLVDYEKLEITPTDLGSGLPVEQSILLTETPDQTYGDSLSTNQDWVQRGLPAPEARDLFKGTGQLASNLYSGTEMLGALHGLTDLLTGLSSTVDSADWVDIDLITDGRPERRAWWDARDGGAGVAIPLPAALGGDPITASGLLYDDAGAPRIVPTAAGVDQWTQTQTALNQALDQLAQQLDHPQTHLLVEAIGLGSNDRVNFPAIYSDLFSNRTFDNSGSSWSYDVVASDTLPLVTG